MDSANENKVYVGPLSDRIQDEIITLLKHSGIEFIIMDFEDIREKKDSLNWLAKYKEDTVPGHLTCIEFSTTDLELAKKSLNRFFGFDEDEDELPEELREDPSEEAPRTIENNKEKQQYTKVLIGAMFLIIALSFILATFR